ncbi:MAG: hypothetical protein U1A07_24885 [Phenylobacterium sp.]|nr:hypothetical protein [Phenylobacterium sp.]
MSKYKPLSERLSQHAADRWSASFAELEEVLGFPLPKSAREQNAWWRGGEKPHHSAWTEPGWRVLDLDRVAETVVFGRDQAAAAASAAETESPIVSQAKPAERARRVMPTAVVGGAAALLAGGVAVLAGFLARRKGEPWR